MNGETVQLIRDAGVVGAGGAGFPTHVKVTAQAELVIINGAECEPLLRVDQQLMVEQADLLIRGLEAIVKATGAQEGIIGIKGKHKHAVEVLEQAVQGKPLRVFALDDFFPAGDEQVLVYEVTGRVVPEGGIPIKVGCVVTNVETAINVAHALNGKPVTTTWLTITGDVPEPITIELPIGVSYREAIALAGRTDLTGMAVIDGGPMMGKVLEDLDGSINKTTKGLIVLPENHSLIEKKTMDMRDILRRGKAACIQCALCTQECPRHLLGHKLAPHKIMRTMAYLRNDDAAKMALTCCECGICELWACPMMLSPRTINAALKKELASHGIRPDAPEPEYQASSVRAYRKVPVKRLIARIGLKPYDTPAPLKQVEYRPQTVRIPLRQHIGAPAVPLVKVGQQVEEGMLIASIPEGALGANVHASISGTVVQVSDLIEIRSEGERGVQ